MYHYDRALADEHIADMKRTADRYRLAKLAQCCTAVVNWFDSVRCRLRGSHRSDRCDISLPGAESTADRYRGR